MISTRFMLISCSEHRNPLHFALQVPPPHLEGTYARTDDKLQGWQSDYILEDISDAVMWFMIKIPGLYLENYRLILVCVFV
jgi:hypothetical protein